eukprot:5099170-Amphidinium_carterae.1
MLYEVGALYALGSQAFETIVFSSGYIFFCSCFACKGVSLFGISRRGLKTNEKHADRSENWDARRLRLSAPRR